MPNYDAIVADADQQIARASRTKRNSGILIARSKNTVKMSKEIVRTSSEIRADLQRQQSKKSRQGNGECLIHARLDYPRARRVADRFEHFRTKSTTSAPEFQFKGLL